MTVVSPERILADLAVIVRDAFPDRDFPPEVDGETRLFGDLGLASIDAIYLAEKVEAWYGSKLPFGPFLAGLHDAGAEDLRLADLVSFLHTHLTR